MNKKDPSFSLYEFRSWLSKHKEPESNKRKTKSEFTEAVIGKTIESRLGIARLQDKIKENNKTKIADILANDFKENGGEIISVNELLVEVKVESGEFKIPMIYTKRKS